MATQTANAELQKLAPSAIIALYILDATAIEGEILRFYPGTSEAQTPIIWQGNTYNPLPVELRGMEYNGQGAPPRPSLFIMNGGGAISALCLAFDDLIGAKVTRKRTFVKYLDGYPDEDPTQELPEDIYFIERKMMENKYQVEFELATQMVLDDLALPKRRVHANLCAWKYRSSECSYAGTAVSDSEGNVFAPVVDRGEWDEGADYVENDAAFITLPSGTIAYFWCIADNTNQRPPNTTYWKRDQCPKTVLGCRARFPQRPQGLPFGGFPGTKRLA